MWVTAAGHLEGTQGFLVLVRSPLCTSYLDAKMIGPLYSSFSYVCVPYAGLKKPSAFPSVCLDQLALNLEYQVHDLSLCTFCIHCMIIIFF